MAREHTGSEACLLVEHKDWKVEVVAFQLEVEGRLEIVE